MIDQEFLTVKETAVIFAVHPNTILNAIHKGYLIAIRIGKGKRSPYRISKKSIEAIHSKTISILERKSN